MKLDQIENIARMAEAQVGATTVLPAAVRELAVAVVELVAFLRDVEARTGFGGPIVKVEPEYPPAGGRFP